MIPFNRQPLPPDRRRLLELYKGLSPGDRDTLLAFAEFLAQRGAEETDAPPPLREPRTIPRPASESVVAAIRRLTDTYYMLERQVLLNDTASLMAEHVMQGRPATEVVDRLESVFRNHYQRYLEANGE